MRSWQQSLSGECSLWVYLQAVTPLLLLSTQTGLQVNSLIAMARPVWQCQSAASNMRVTTCAECKAKTTCYGWR